MDNVSWTEINDLMRIVFAETPVAINVCTNNVRIPPPEEREGILEENHASAIGGHKGVTKTYLRIKSKYFWPGMKRDIESHIRACQNCQLKKLVRCKTKQPILTPRTRLSTKSLSTSWAPYRHLEMVIRTF